MTCPSSSRSSRAAIRGPAILFKPTDGVPRRARRSRTFYYWFADEPTSPVTVQIMDAAGAVVYNQTGQPGTGTGTAAAVWPTPPWPRPSRLAAAAVDAARGGAPAVDPTGGGGGRGRGGFGGGGGPAVSAHKGLNSATWNPQTAVAVHGAAAHRDVGRRRRTDEGGARRLHRQGQHGQLVADADLPAQHGSAPHAAGD